MAAIVPVGADAGAAPGLPPSTIAETMLELVQDGKYPGGSIMNIDETQKTCPPIAPDIWTRSWDKTGPIEVILDKERNSASSRVAA